VALAVTTSTSTDFRAVLAAVVVVQTFLQLVMAAQRDHQHKVTQVEQVLFRAVAKELQVAVVAQAHLGLMP